MNLWWLALSICFQAQLVLCQINQLSSDEINQIYMKLLMQQLGGYSTVTEKQCEYLLPEPKGQIYKSIKNCTFLSGTEAESCFSNKCLSVAEIYTLHSIPHGGATSTQMMQMCSSILYQINNKQCEQVNDTNTDDQPTTTEVWGYSVICVTAISLCSLGGVLFIGVMNKAIWKRFMMFMVALAVGTLAGSGILVLIPEAFELHEPNNPHHDDYIWISTTIMGGVYLFFVTERLLRIITRRREEKAGINMAKNVELVGVNTIAVDGKNGYINGGFQSVNGLHVTESTTDSNTETPGVNTTKEDEKILEKLGQIKSVAWMIVFGDALHNFIDGLAIGAAFVESTLTGFSVSLAVFCEELPHELGDFAILLNSGMSMRMAVICNFLSACTCFLGLVIGINIGELTSGGLWIFAIAGGMFLYISLADMLPELYLAAEEEEKATGATWPVFFIQNIGLIVGFCIILVMSLYGGEIEF